jgi:hypothetical protein
MLGRFLGGSKVAPFVAWGFGLGVMIGADWTRGFPIGQAIGLPVLVSMYFSC